MLNKLKIKILATRQKYISSLSILCNYAIKLNQIQLNYRGEGGERSREEGGGWLLEIPWKFIKNMFTWKMSNMTFYLD